MSTNNDRLFLQRLLVFFGLLKHWTRKKTLSKYYVSLLSDEKQFSWLFLYFFSFLIEINEIND